ncbi:MAG TPA: hypothetical protein PKA95_14220 [Thermomicrobiales bacterium]|nr:hypothetical protein [Thermomicrobiales bacterium]
MATPPQRTGRKNPLLRGAAVLLGVVIGLALLGRLDSSGLPILIGAAIGVALVLAVEHLRRP